MRNRIGIVDDHPAMVVGTTSIINMHDSLLVTGVGASVGELFRHDTHYDLVLLDLVLADGSRPADNIRILNARGIPVVVYSCGEYPHLEEEALATGALDTIPKSQQPFEIVRAINKMVTREASNMRLTGPSSRVLDTLISPGLTRREKEVLARYASGETAESVGRHLFISRETVLDHIRKIRAKYAAIDRPSPSKLDLYRRAVEDGMIAGD